jgi:RHS repeat-associated protein
LLESATEDTGLLISNSTPISHSYDANGSLIGKSSLANDPYNNQKYQYDAGNRLTAVQTPGGDTIASYQYDPLGRRIRKTEYRELNAGSWQILTTPRTTTFYYTDEGLAAEYTQTGNTTPELKTQYGWEPNGMWGTSPVFLKTTRSGQSTPEYFYAQNDHLGTPQQLIDQDGAIVWAQRAEAFGKTAVVQEAVTNNLRFPGQYYDRETDTHYNYFRDYEPSTGRYVQQDPIGLDGGWNIYGYVGGNPLSKVDPIGEFAIALPALPAFGEALMTVGTYLLGGTAMAAILSLTGDSSEDQSRAVPYPDRRRGKYTCICRANKDGRSPDNCSNGNQEFAMGYGEGATLREAKRAAEKDAKEKLGAKSTHHPQCRCTSPNGDRVIPHG